MLQDDGVLSQSTFSEPWGIATDKEGQNLFVAEVGTESKMRMISLIHGPVTIIGKPGIDRPSSVACHHKTGDLFVTDHNFVKRMHRVHSEDGTLGALNSMQWLCMTTISSSSRGKMEL
jgi:hypothetical protein